jgi:hypothetical protein
MLLAQGPLQNAFWQWMNQAHNASVNYFNANKTAQSSTKETALSFAVATSSAVAICLGMDKVVQRMRVPVLARFVPFIAVATANTLNISTMRRKELSDGIAVFDDLVCKPEICVLALT